MGREKIVMKRAWRGLYEGRHIVFGNKISEDGGNKSRRCWRPNVQKKRVYSIAMDRYVQIRLTTHALRVMDKWGGFDQYLLKKQDKELGERFICWKRHIEGLYREKEDLQQKIKDRITKKFEELHKPMVSEEDGGGLSAMESPPESEILDEALAKLNIGQQGRLSDSAGYGEMSSDVQPDEGVNTSGGFEEASSQNFREKEQQ